MSRTRPPAASTWNGRASCATWNQAWPRSRRRWRCRSSNESASAVPASSTAVLPSASLHHSWRIAAAHITARQQQRMRSGRDHQHHGRSRCQQPRQATARCDRPQPLAVGGQLGQRGQHSGPGSVQPLPEGLLLAPGQRMARIGLQPALQGALLAFRQRACTAPYHPAQRLPGLTRRGFGRGHGCGLPHREWVRFPVVTTAGTICPRQSPLIGPFPCCCWISSAARSTCLPTRLLEIPRRAAISPFAQAQVAVEHEALAYLAAGPGWSGDLAQLRLVQRSRLAVVASPRPCRWRTRPSRAARGRRPWLRLSARGGRPSGTDNRAAPGSVDHRARCWPSGRGSAGCPRCWPGRGSATKRDNARRSRISSSTSARALGDIGAKPDRGMMGVMATVRTWIVGCGAAGGKPRHESIIDAWRGWRIYGSPAPRKRSAR